MKKESLKKNFIMNILLTMSSFIFPLISFPYISRILGPVGTGKVSFGLSLISYFSMFAQLGIPTYGIRACAKVRDNRKELTKTVHELLIINLITNIISYTALAISLVFIPRLQKDKILYVIIGSTIFLTSLGVEWLYKGLEKYSYITIRSVAFKFIALLAMFVLVHKESDYIIYGAMSIFASSASCLLNFFNMHKYIDFNRQNGYKPFKHLSKILVFFGMTCATTIYTNLDAVMLGFMKNDIDVGYYNAAVKIKFVLVSIVTSLGTVLMPRASYYVEHGETKKLGDINARAINFISLIAIPLTVYFIIFAKPTIVFLSGVQYENSIIPMQIIMPTIYIIGIANIFGMQILIPNGKEIIVMKSQIAGAVTDLVLNTLLIPHLASSGAAIGTVVAEIVVTLFQYKYVKNDILIALKEIQYYKIALAVVLASFLSVLISKFHFSDFITLLLSATIFFLIYLVVLIVMREKLTNSIISGIKVKMLKRNNSR